MNSNEFVIRIFNLGKLWEHHKHCLLQRHNLTEQEVDDILADIKKIENDIESAKYELNIVLSCGDTEPWAKHINYELQHPERFT